jgi:hypothetical protein
MAIQYSVKGIAKLLIGHTTLYLVIHFFALLALLLANYPVQ